jgi:ABC-2 type transport system permease protein
MSSIGLNLDSSTAAGVVVARPGASVTTGSLLVAKRALLKYMRTPQLIVLSSLQMSTFLVGFRFVFGGAIGESHGLPYVDFAVPGFIAAGVLFTTLGTSVAMAEDLQNGFIDRMRSLPMPAASVLIGRALADTCVLAWSLAVTTVIGFLIGFTLHGSVLYGVAAFGLCLGFGFAFSWVFIALGLLVKDPQAAQSLLLVVFILTFVSNAYAPAETMPDWIRGFAENQPLSQMADAVRALTLGDQAQQFLGQSASYYVIISLAWTVGIVAAFFGMAVALFRRR